MRRMYTEVGFVLLRQKFTVFWQDGAVNPSDVVLTTGPEPGWYFRAGAVTCAPTYWAGASAARPGSGKQQRPDLPWGFHFSKLV
jgi:hypothetical protein